MINMTLADFTTEYERRSAISYSKADGCTAVRNFYDVQHIVGPLYKEREVKNEWGEDESSLFLFFPNVKDGFLWQYKMRNLSRYTPEKMLEEIVRFKMDTPGNFEQYLEKAMDEGRFVGNAMIRFIRQWNPVLADRCVTYREDYLRRRAEQEAVRQQEYEAEEARKKAEQEAELQAEKDKYLGWADDMTPMKFGKVKARMESLVRVNGEVMPKREFIISLLKKGYTPQLRENVVSWNKRTGEQNKPKTEHRMTDGERFYVVSKTEFDFAMYIEAHQEVIN